MHIPQEITERTGLVAKNNQLNPLSVGWMRQPLIDTSGIDGRRSWGRNKRWEYWCVITPETIMALTVSSLDYAGVYEVWVYDRESGQEWGKTAVSALPRLRLPANLADSSITVKQRDLYIEILEGAGSTRLRARIPGAQFEATIPLPPEHERLGVVVPWSRDQFQYTVKDLGRPARGFVKFGKKARRFSHDTYAILDHGRGRWPREVQWNWGTAQGEIPGWNILFDQSYLDANPLAREATYRVGVQFGAKWTDGTGVTENSVVVNDRLYKIHDDVQLTYDLNRWRDPWRIVGGGIDLTMTPFHNKKSRTQLRYLASRTDQVFGQFDGVITLPGFATMMVTDLVGFAEEVEQLW